MADTTNLTTVKAAGSIIASTSFTTVMLLATISKKKENKTKNYHKIKVAATHRTMHLKSNKDISNG
jgi:hypothetical protein